MIIFIHDWFLWIFEIDLGKAGATKPAAFPSELKLSQLYQFVNTLSVISCEPMERGAVLARLRSRAGLSQGELAEALGMHLQTISKWERGLRSFTLSPDHMLELCRILNCTLEELAGEEA